MNRKDVIQAWERISAGYKPLLSIEITRECTSIEITRECPLRCPGCYCLRGFSPGPRRDSAPIDGQAGEELVAGVLRLVDKHRPLHLSIVGGDPLVRYRDCSASAGVKIDSGSLGFTYGSLGIGRIITIPGPSVRSVALTYG